MTSDAVIRPIEEQDVGAVVDLMAESFTSRTPDYFRQGLDRLSQRDVPQGGQRWGYLLEDEGAVRGAVLSISSVHDYGSFQQTYANISTWCVNPSHRGPLAKKLYNAAAGPEDWVTTNLSAAKHTVRTLDQLQFRARTTGQFIALSSRGKSAPAGMISVQEGIAHSSVLHLIVLRHSVRDLHLSLGRLAFPAEAPVRTFVSCDLLPKASLIAQQ